MCPSLTFVVGLAALGGQGGPVGAQGDAGGFSQALDFGVRGNRGLPLAGGAGVRAGGPPGGAPAARPCLPAPQFRRLLRGGLGGCTGVEGGLRW